MEYYNNTLCISHTELTNGIASKSLIDKWKRNDTVKQSQQGGNGRQALFTVDSLPPKYKLEVYRRNPDLKAVAESKLFIDSIEPDTVAISFFQTHKLEDGRNLDPQKQNEYSNNAAILNAFHSVLEKATSQRIKQSNKRVNKSEFWGKAAAALPRLADNYPNSLPENARRLQGKYSLYIRGGYETLVSGVYGKKNAIKAESEEQQSVLKTLLSDRRNLDNVQIMNLYNYMAEQLDWKIITSSAVGVWRKKFDLEISIGLLGATNFHNKKAMQNKREKPTAPLLFWTMDGWDVELYYQAKTENKKGHNVTTYSNRLTMVVVLDPCGMYPVGYAIGTHETPELISDALRDAANHTAELFGMRYKVNQLQSDRYAMKTMLPLYSAISQKVTPARAKNAKSKIIEPYFNYLNKKYFQYAGNWSGFGITSNKNKQPNADALNKHKKEFPDVDGCIQQIGQIMEIERNNKREAYLSQWDKLSEDRKLPFSDEQYLLNFGAETGRKNSLEGGGLLPTIGGIKRAYDCYDIRFRQYSHVRWTIKYDPNNLDKVLAISEDGTLRFMLEDKYIQPMALADRKDGDAEELTRVDNYNKGLYAHVTAKLALAAGTCQSLLAANPQLNNSLAKAMLTDSTGQHKNRRNEKRLRAVDVDAIEVTTVNTANVKTIDVSFGEDAETEYDL